jgi:hypothetical protein
MTPDVSVGGLLAHANFWKNLRIFEGIKAVLENREVRRN